MSSRHVYVRDLLVFDTIRIGGAIGRIQRIKQISNTRFDLYLKFADGSEGWHSRGSKDIVILFFGQAEIPL